MLLAGYLCRMCNQCLHAALGSGVLCAWLLNSRWHQQLTAGSGIHGTGAVPEMCHRIKILTMGRCKISLQNSKLFLVSRMSKTRHS